MNANSPLRVAVIGGGLSGLTAAATAARAGARVQLFERSRQLGGRAATQHKGDFFLNYGPHALYRAGIGRDVLAELGVSADGQRAPVDGWVRSGDRLERLPSTTWSALRSGLLNFSEKVEFGGLMNRLATLDTADLRHVPVAEWLEREVGARRVAEVAHMFMRLSTYANSPDLSAATAIEQLQLGARGGVDYLHEGWQTLIDALADRARTAGATLHSARGVRRLSRDGDGWQLEFDSEPSTNFDRVIIAASPKLTGELLSSVDVRPPRAALDAQPVRAACLDVALDALPDSSRRFVLDIDAPLYLSVHSTVARMAPEGGAVIHVAKYLPVGAEDDADATLAQLEALLDRAQPGWRDQVVERRYLPRIAVAHRLDTAETGGPAGRASPVVAGAPGVLLCGDWVGSEGWLADAALASGRRAGRLAASTDDSLARAA